MPHFDGTFPPRGGAVLPVQIAVSQEAEDWLRDNGQPIPSPIQVQALIDLGAARTAISETVVVTIGIPTSGTTLIVTADGKSGFYPLYDVRLQFGSGVEYPITAVQTPFSVPSQPGVECLIGCDVLVQWGGNRP